MRTDSFLAELQAYPLEIKEMLTFQRIRELTNTFGNEFYVSFSGGKDSAVAVSFTARSLKRLGYNKMYVVYVNTGLEYSSVSHFVKPYCEEISKREGIEIIPDILYPEEKFPQVLKTHGYPIISKEVSQVVSEARRGIASGGMVNKRQIAQMKGERLAPDGTKSRYNYGKYEFLLDAPFRISNKCCKCTKKAPVLSYEKKTGRIPLVATMTEESQLRKTAWLRFGCNSFDTDRPRSAPFSFWTEQDILHYHVREELPIASAYGKVEAYYEGQVNGQLSIFDLEETNKPELPACKYRTTKCNRTGCLYCLYGIQSDPERIKRVITEEPKKSEYALNGGAFDENGLWGPSKDGLGLWFVLEYLNKHGVRAVF